MEGDSRTLKTTRTSLEIVELLGRLDGAGVTRLAEELDRPPSTGHSHLATLHEQEFVTNDVGIYRVGLKFLELGRIVEISRRLYRIADDYTAKVASETQCRSIFAVEEHGWGVYVSRNAGDLSVWEHETIGSQFHLHSTAAGKAILAYLSEEIVERIFDRRGLPKQTDETITDRSELADALETVRERGVAFNREEQVQGVKAVSAPILSQDGRVLGALSANGPAEQMVGELYETEIPRKLLGIANEFELDLELGGAADQPQ